MPKPRFSAALCARVALVLVCVLAPALAAAPAMAGGHGRQRALTVSIPRRAAGPPIPADFLGFSFEAKSLPQVGQYGSEGNLITLMRSLGTGVIRFGGITLDTQATWSDNGRKRPSWANTLISASDFNRLADLVHATGWRVILGVTLGHYDPDAAAREVAAAQAALGPSLAGVEIGNEPDSYVLHGLRSPPWDFSTYKPQVDAYMQAISKAAPGVPLAGPDASSSQLQLTWLGSEAAQASPALLTAHYYSLGCQDPRASLGRLLTPRIQRAARQNLTTMARLSQSSGIPLRVDETNNISCGGMPGVSNTFLAALWAVDYLTRAMSAGVSGVNFHTIFSSCSGYAPFCAQTPDDLSNGNLTAQPEWYALLLARRLIGDRVLQAVIRPRRSDIGVTVLQSRQGRVHVVIVDDDPPGFRPTVLRLRVGRRFASGTLLRLTAPFPAATSQVTLGGRSVASDGSWSPPSKLPRLANRSGTISVTLGPSSAALLTLLPRR